MTHPYFEGAPWPRVLAHRGLTQGQLSGDDVFENTAAAFANAHAAGAVYIESDCRLTADGDVVLFHDETLERLFADSRTVRSVRTRELAELMAPHGGLLTVPEALAAFPTLRFNIDVKERIAAEQVGALVAAHGARVLLTSFSDATRRAAMDAAARRSPEVLPAASAGQRTTALLRAIPYASGAISRRILRGVHAVQVPETAGSLRVVTSSFVRRAHAAGAEVHVWTVNDPARMVELVTFGVDGIVTDRADLALKALNPI